MESVNNIIGYMINLGENFSEDTCRFFQVVMYTKSNVKVLDAYYRHYTFEITNIHWKKRVTFDTARLSEYAADVYSDKELIKKAVDKYIWNVLANEILNSEMEYMKVVRADAFRAIDLRTFGKSGVSVKEEDV